MERLVGSVHYRPMRKIEPPERNIQVKGPPSRKVKKEPKGNLNVKFRGSGVTGDS